MQCGHCHGFGHNIRTCEILTERLRQLADRDIKSGRTDSVNVRSYNQRVNPKKRPRRSVSCGYGGESGHTRRTCKPLIEDRHWYVSYYNGRVDVSFDYINRSEIGVGTLFTRQRREWVTGSGYRPVLDHHVVTGFSVGHAIQECTSGAPIVLETIVMKSGLSHPISMRNWVRHPAQTHYGVTMVSPVPGRLPDSWKQENHIDFEMTKDLPMFVRTGDKHCDSRDWNLMTLDLIRSGNSTWSSEQEARLLTAFEPETLRQGLMRDFEGS